MGVNWVPKQRCLLPDIILVLISKGTPKLAVASVSDLLTFDNHTLPKLTI